MSAFQLQPFALGLGDAGVEFLELFDDDVLLVLHARRPGSSRLYWASSSLGGGEALAQALLLFGEEVLGLPGGLETLFEGLLVVFVHDGLGTGARRGRGSRSLTRISMRRVAAAQGHVHLGEHAFAQFGGRVGRATGAGVGRRAGSYPGC